MMGLSQMGSLKRCPDLGPQRTAVLKHVTDAPCCKLLRCAPPLSGLGGMKIFGHLLACLLCHKQLMFGIERAFSPYMHAVPECLVPSFAKHLSCTGCCARAGWVTEGEVAFEEMSGSPPLSVRQQALRGLAKIALERGERTLAKSQYERILGKVLLGRGPPAEHWAHAEYAWLQFEDGDLQVQPLPLHHTFCI